MPSSSSSSSPASSPARLVPRYRDLLALPRVLPALAAGSAVRLSYATVSLSLLAVVHTATGSYAAAGTVVGAYTVPFLSAPAKGRLLDAHARTVLLVLGGGCATALGALVACAAGGVRAPGAYAALGAAAGLLAPPAGPVVRGVWARATQPGPARQRAYGLDAITEEGAFALGPLVVGALIGAPGLSGGRGGLSALALTAVLVLGGCLALAAALPVGSAAEAPAASEAPSSRLGPLSAPGARWTALVLLAVGLGTSPVELAVLALGRSAGRPGAVGPLLAVLAVASVASALAWGRRTHRRSAPTHLLGLLVVLAAAVGAASLAADTGGASALVALAPALAATGAAVAPVSVVAYALVDDLVLPAHRTEASTWLSSAHSTGLAVGSAAAGAVLDRAGASSALAAGALVLAASAAALASGAGRPPSSVPQSAGS